ncbi:hypothetical protein JS562_54630, partial [Agrobacterium sp. S2]|nr:hypothetical protein [Agrobacterium sp. S2]
MSVDRSGVRPVGLMAGLTALAMIPGVIVALTDGGPSVFMDEALYRTNADSIAEFGAYAEPHYPPLYPALLALAHLTDHWFRAMLLLNVVAGAMIVPATWLLVRALGMRRAWIPVALSALLPFHGAFAGYLLSENLALPIFVLTAALAVRGRRSEGVWLGIALGALHLTRYFFLPIVPVVAVIWFLRVLRVSGTGWREQ